MHAEAMAAILNLGYVNSSRQSGPKMSTFTDVFQLGGTQTSKGIIWRYSYTKRLKTAGRGDKVEKKFKKDVQLQCYKIELTPSSVLLYTPISVRMPS
jgi:hypothetical protein